MFRISINIIIISLFNFLHTVEHCLFFASAIYSYQQKKKNCNYNFDDDWRYFFINEYKYIFNAIPYSFPMALFVVVRMMRE